MRHWHDLNPRRYHCDAQEESISSVATNTFMLNVRGREGRELLRSHLPGNALLDLDDAVTHNT